MRVLVLESERHAADEAIQQLEAAGHRIDRCHEPDLSAFPCNALCDDGTCPLEDGREIDVALTVRSHAWPRPTAYEDGVSCALRHGLPLVVAGVSAMNPFAAWTTRIADGEDVVEACALAASGPVDRLIAPARTELLRRLHRVKAPTDGAAVDVRRRGRTLRALVTLPDAAPELESEVAVSVAGVLRDRERYAACIDVAVTRASDGAAPALPSRSAL